MAVVKWPVYFSWIPAVEDINPIRNKISDLKGRATALRGYL
jgi:hypothetical protein